MDKIPVKFTYQGKEYSGTLSEVFGGGSADIYHLMIDNYYWGCLRKYKDQWVFDPATDEWLKEYAGYFGNIVTGWNLFDEPTSV